MAETIDWSKISGAYGVVGDMRQRLQAVADGDPQALGHIMGHLEHQETLYPLTAVVIPFLLDILNGDNRADKAALLDQLHFIVETHDTRCLQLDNLRGTFAKILIDLQTALVAGAPVYLKLLNDHDPAIRLRASVFVGMYADAVAARAAIRAALAQEIDTMTRAVLVYQLGTLPPSNQAGGDSKANEAAKREFLEWATHDKTAREVKIASALAWVNHQLSEAFGSYTTQADPILDLLLDVVLEKYGAAQQPAPFDAAAMAQDFAEFDAWMLEQQAAIERLRQADPAAAMAQSLELFEQATAKLGIDPGIDLDSSQTSEDVQSEEPAIRDALPDYLSVLFSPGHILWVLRQFSTRVESKLLASPRLTPPLAHRIGRDLIDRAFDRVNHARDGARIPYGEDDDWLRWNEFIEFTERFELYPAQMVYKRPSEQAYKTRRELNPGQYHALKAVVDCDAFWLLPTNLFSFFYGLPDDRNALRQWAQQHKPAYIRDE